MKLEANDLRYLIGRELHDLLCALGDYSANPRGSKGSLATRAAKQDVQEERLATLKGTTIGGILRGMGKNTGRDSKATLAKRVCATLAKREKAANPKPAKSAVIKVKSAVVKVKAAAPKATKKTAKKPWDVSDDEEEFSGFSDTEDSNEEDSEVEEVPFMLSCGPPYLRCLLFTLVGRAPEQASRYSRFNRRRVQQSCGAGCSARARREERC
jgi:hypothetical protein